MPELDKVFSPESIEKKWYNKWIENKSFARKIDYNRESFCVLMPPPNVTGVLHMGHLLNNTIQDVLIRLARHENKSALWVPGTDHAGISMQVKVEKELAQQGINWKKIGREEFLKYSHKWSDEHKHVIFSQLKKLCVSPDWDSNINTLSEDYSKGVLRAFVDLYNRGYIYRGKKIVNWCPATMTALSDEEVIMTPRKSKLYKVCYEVVEQPGKFIEVCTTRPETIMADVAIAVNPDDERFVNLIGLHCWRPLNKKEIPIISDSVVDKEFGTGALKITPAHDIIDFEVGQRHKLPVIDVINPDGTMNDLAGEFAGLDRFVAREKAADQLKKIGAIGSIDDYENSIGISERGGVPIEPRISKQWFMKYPKVDEAKRAVELGLIKFFPERWQKTYLYWLDNIKDWCVSRQLWWGHRIPVWYKKNADRNDAKNTFVSVEPPSDIENWEQDQDVLDTWFSSWLWPFGVFGWPNYKKMQHEGFNYFFPTNTLVTGPDIIFFWVARMIISSLEFVGDEKKTLTDDEIAQRIPFKNVYFTGIIRDEIGRKMSKSLGNSPEPLDLIAKYGSDSVRLGLLMISPNGHDVIFSEERMSQGRNFCNKLWNVFRFRSMQGDFKPSKQLDDLVKRIKLSELDIDDHAILLKLSNLRKNFANLMQKFELNNAVQALYSFFWGDYCDWYVEVSKPRLRTENETVLAVHDIVLRQLLLMLNPFIPCITEELWAVGMFGENSMQDITLESFDEITKAFEGLRLSKNSLQVVENFTEFITKGRALKVKLGKSTEKIKFLLNCSYEKNIFIANCDKLAHLLGAKNIELIDKSIDLPATLTSIGMLYIDLKSNVSAEEESAKIKHEIDEIDNLILINQNKLNNEKFIKNAPAKIVDGARQMLNSNVAKKSELEKLLSKFLN